MTAERKNGIEKFFYWVVGIIITILLGSIAWMGNQGLTLMKDLVKDNQKLNESYIKLDNWTHSVYEYEISNNTKRSINNEERIYKLEVKGSDKN